MIKLMEINPIYELLKILHLIPIYVAPTQPPSENPSMEHEDLYLRYRSLMTFLPCCIDCIAGKIYTIMYSVIFFCYKLKWREGVGCKLF